MLITYEYIILVIYFVYQKALILAFTTSFCNIIPQITGYFLVKFGFKKI